jgi:fucose 4-O-acetylase-like acetyltransferase
VSSESVPKPPPEALPLAPPRSREVYLDAFRGLMALVMIQGHVSDSLLTPAIRGSAWYQWEVIFHGSTAPGFLFASGFVAGLARAPLPLSAVLRRGRRLLFVLGVGYALHLPYASFWKTLQASPDELAALFQCNALQAISITQLCVLLLQFFLGRRWRSMTFLLLLLVLLLGPFVWAGNLSTRLPPALGAYLDSTSGSPFPLFPFASFVLGGALAGSLLGRDAGKTRRRRTVQAGVALVVLGILLSILLEGRVDFWGVSPAYVSIRLGGLLLLLRLVEGAARRKLPGIPAVAILGRETLLVYVVHLILLFGGITGTALLGDYVGELGVRGVVLVLLVMVPFLYLLARLWHAAKQRSPREAQLAIVFVTVAFVYEFMTRPW